MTPGTPDQWNAGSGPAAQFQHRLRESSQTLLICDYDGTLAPFRVNKMEAVPMPGVEEQLRRIAAGRSRIAFVTGRPVVEVIQLMPLAAEAEIWGMHGREHRTADGATRLLQPSPEQRAALDAATEYLRKCGLSQEIERKVASVAVHWRAAPAGTRERATIERAAQEAFAPHLGRNAMAMLPFDGGAEMRAEDRNKGHAVEELLKSSPDPSASAFLGDDTTDEDAFRAIAAAGGLALLVRDPPIPSLAHFVLPPHALLAFLSAWPS